MRKEEPLVYVEDDGTDPWSNGQGKNKYIHPRHWYRSVPGECGQGYVYAMENYRENIKERRKARLKQLKQLPRKVFGIKQTIRNLRDHYSRVSQSRWQRGLIVEPEEEKKPPTDVPLAIYEQGEVERMNGRKYKNRE